MPSSMREEANICVADPGNRRVLRSIIKGASMPAVPHRLHGHSRSRRCPTKVDAENTKYPQRHTIDVGDEPGHTVGVFERSTLSVGQITGGTGKFSGMRGLVRARGASDGKRGFNETQAEIEYWFVDR